MVSRQARVDRCNEFTEMLAYLSGVPIKVAFSIFWRDAV